MRLTWPSTMLAQVGVLASSKSAMKTRAPQLSALITMRRSVGPGDLDAAVLQVLGHRRDAPGVVVAHALRLGQEVRVLAGVEARLTLGALGQQFFARRVEAKVQLGEEVERFRRQNLCEPAFDRSFYLNVRGHCVLP